MFPQDSSFDIMFRIGPLIIGVVFCLVVILIAVSIVKGVKQWSYNNQQPVLTVPCKAVAKRTNVSHTHHNDDGHLHESTTTTYYVTFEVESRDRMEFQVNGREYGQIAEGDQGKLTFQGTRYLGFERQYATARTAD